MLSDNALTCPHSFTDDKNRDNIDPDKLKNGITDYPSPEDKEILYMFFARYVRKVHSDSAIKSELRNNEGLSFVDIISPSDIAFVISVIKNGWDVWDQKIRMNELGAAVHVKREVNVRPLFTEGTGKKKEQGKSLWSDEGMKYFKHVENTWRKVYKNDEMMRGIYGGFETWLNKYGKEITVAKHSMTTLHSIIARWTSKDKCKLGKRVELESNESKDEEDERYCSDKGNNLLSRMWLREERENQKRNKHTYDNRRCNSNKRNDNVNSSDGEDGDDNVSGGGIRERLDKKQQGRKGNKSDSLGKVTRSSKRGESGNSGTRAMRVRN